MEAVGPPTELRLRIPRLIKLFLSRQDDLKLLVGVAKANRSKGAYEALHPETKHGAIGNGREKSRQVGDSSDDRFTADTAAKTGQSERVVQQKSGPVNLPVHRAASTPRVRPHGVI